MPTPNPSVIQFAVTAPANLFTANWPSFVLAAVALTGIIVLPAIVASAGLQRAVLELSSLFHLDGAVGNYLAQKADARWKVQHRADTNWWRQESTRVRYVRRLNKSHDWDHAT